MFRKTTLLVLLITVLLATALSACSGSPLESGASGHGSMKMAPLHEMPEAVRIASQTTQQAYQFAVANPDILEEIPCYCGCGDMGHDSSYDCYVAGVQDGKVIFDEHALGCSICVDIVVDTMRMLGEGKDTVQIRAAIDETYSRYGPSNMAE